MRPFRVLMLVSVLAVSLLGCRSHAQTLRLVLVTDGLAQPVAVAHAADERLFVVEQAGVIRVVDSAGLASQPFLDIRDRVGSGGERGLLGLAFPSDFASSGRFYAYYTDRSGTSVLSRFRVSDDPSRADPASEEVLIIQAQPRANHNGGQLAFGPDGYLYWGLGDGGGGGDPTNAGQNLATLLGKLLRIDVGPSSGYAVPPTNPFVTTEGALDEIWAYGLRNPWRFSFDRATGDLYVADVGQNQIEEVNFQSAGSPGGQNYGWNVMEGDACFAPASGCDQSGLVLPVFTYRHGPTTGRSITGGYVYRGQEIPELSGRYLYGDYVSGRVWVTDAASGWEGTLLWDADFSISTFGEDAAGELYVVDHDGRLYRLAPSD